MTAGGRNRAESARSHTMMRAAGDRAKSAESQMMMRVAGRCGKSHATKSVPPTGTRQALSDSGCCSIP